MKGPTRIPVHPIFRGKQFNPKKHAPMPEEVNPQPSFNDPDIDDDFDMYDEYSPAETNPDSKKKYDWMVIIMAVIIIVLVLVIIWQVLANNDDKIPEHMITPQYMRAPQQYTPVQAQYMAAQQAQYMAAQQTPPKQQVSQPPKQQVSQPPTTEEMDNVLETLKKKTKKCENLSLDEYTVSSKNESYDDIYENDKEVELLDESVENDDVE